MEMHPVLYLTDVERNFKCKCWAMDPFRCFRNTSYMSILFFINVFMFPNLMKKHGYSDLACFCSC